MKRQDPKTGAAGLLRLWESAANEMVFSLDAERRFLFASPAARRLFGVPAASLRGKRFEAAAPANEQETVTAWLTAIAAGAHPEPLVHRIRPRRGGELWVESSARRVRGAAPRRLELHGACRDVDRHKRFEINVERVAQQWRATVDAASDAILMLDTSLRVLRLNRSAADLLQLNYAEALDHEVTALLASRLGLRHDLGLAAALATGERREGDLWIARRRLWMRSQVAPIRDRGDGIAGAVLVLRDVTSQRRAEQRLVRSHDQLRSLSAHFQRAAEASRAELARELHDELGALLTALKLDLAWLESKLGPRAANLRERAHEAVKVSDLAVAAVRRISSELHPAVLESLGLPAAIEWHCRELQKRSDLEVRVEVPNEELEIDDTVAIALFRILQEATTNVLRHARAKRLLVRLWMERGALALRVEDDGSGFDRRKLPTGRGIGLLGMQERAGMIGARVTIQSQPGRGTVVTTRRRLAG